MTWKLFLKLILSFFLLWKIFMQQSLEEDCRRWFFQVRNAAFESLQNLLLSGLYILPCYKGQKAALFCLERPERHSSQKSTLLKLEEPQLILKRTEKWHLDARLDGLNRALSLINLERHGVHCAPGSFILAWYH